MTTPSPQAVALLVKALVLGGVVMSLAGVWLLASGTKPLAGGVILAAGVLDLGMAFVLARRS